MDSPFDLRSSEEALPAGADREQEFLASVFRHFEKVGSPLPKNLVVVDLETSGFSPTNDHILSIGHLIVEDGVITSSTNSLLNWPDSGLIDSADLRDRMDRTRTKMQENGKTYQMDYEELRSKGLNPLDALKQYYDLFHDHAKAGDGFLVHGGIRFDIPRLQEAWRRWINLDIVFPKKNLWDTGVLEKACQIGMHPSPGESLADWSVRVGNAYTKGVHWSLDSHCVRKYNLIEKHSLDMRYAHGAGYDCYLTHILFQEFRARGEKSR